MRSWREMLSFARINVYTRTIRVWPLSRGNDACSLRRSGNVARMKGEREKEREFGESKEKRRRCTGSRFTFDPRKTRETCSCVTQIVNEIFRRLNNGSPLRIRERIRWSKVVLNRGKRFARSRPSFTSSNRKVVHFFF